MQVRVGRGARKVQLTEVTGGRKGKEKKKRGKTEHRKVARQ